MRKHNYIRLLVLLLTFCLLAGCGNNKDLAEAEEVQENNFSFATFPTNFVIETVGDDTSNKPPVAISPDLPLTEMELLYTDSVGNDFIPVRYVMIYNPGMYDAYTPLLNTGSLGTQVEVDLNKGGLQEPITNMSISQDELNGDIPLDELLQDGSRAGTMITPYQVGDTKVFYCYDTVSTSNPRISRKFTCRYAGTYCNVWTADTDMSDALVRDYADQFDNYIYKSVTKAFGEPRFSKNGGKVNLLYYPMPQNLGGCFSMLDLYAVDEISTKDLINYSINTDHDILHLNADLTQYEHLQTFMRSTMAHEFQHLICATDAFSTLYLDICPTWFNEAMSGYIEENLYPGVKEASSGHLRAFREGDLIRNGLSMYNFETNADDIGVYGSVYLYSEYLSKLAGNDVFSKFHKYWRNSYSSTLCDAEALAASVSNNIYLAVDACTPYPTKLKFASEEQKWMSKLTLQFYLELLDKEDSDPVIFNQIDGRDLVYNQINAANIEGGGRIIVALQGDTYMIPKDADRGLFYIGLDKNFNPVTALIYH